MCTIAMVYKDGWIQNYRPFCLLRDFDPKGVMFRLRILVAENNRPSLNLYRDILSKMGHEVATAPHGDAAWDLFCQGEFHAVLVDYKLPGIGGEEFFSRVKKGSPDVDIVLLTGNASIDKIMNLVEMGATDYLVKPVNPQRLREMFEKVAMKQKLLNDGSRLAEELGDLPPVDALPPSSEPASAVREWNGNNLVDRVPSWPSDELFAPPPTGSTSVASATAGSGDRFVEEMGRRVRLLERQLEEVSLDRDELRQTLKEDGAVPGDAGDDSKLSRELERSKDKNRELSEQVRRRSEDLEALEGQVESRTRELQDLERSRGRLQEALEREQERTASGRSEVERLNSKVERLRARSGPAPELAGENERLKGTIERLQSELDELEAREAGDGVADAEEAQRKLEAQVRELETQLVAREKAVRTTRREFESSKAASAAREEAVNFLQDKLKARGQKLKAIKKAARELETELGHYESRAAEGAVEMEQLRSSARDFERKARELTRGNASREAQMRELELKTEEQESELQNVRASAVHSSEEVVRSTEQRFERKIHTLLGELGALKHVLEEKDDKLDELDRDLEETKRNLHSENGAHKREREQHALTRIGLEEELADLREVLSERESFLRKALEQREAEFKHLLEQRGNELAAAQRQGADEANRYESELKDLKRGQRARELQTELQSEWMELGEALVLLDEEVKSKEQENAELKELFAKKEKALEATIANQRRKYKELERSLDDFQQGDASVPAGTPQVSAGARAGARAGESLLELLEEAEPVDFILSVDGVLLQFGRDFNRVLGLDESRRPGRTRLDEIPGYKQLRPLIERLLRSDDARVEKPLYIRAGDSEPLPYWSVGTRHEDPSGECFQVQLYDVSERPDILGIGDFSDAKIVFDAYDDVYQRKLRVKESLFSMRIVFEILNKKFKDDEDLHGMVGDVVRELTDLIELVQEL